MSAKIETVKSPKTKVDTPTDPTAAKVINRAKYITMVVEALKELKERSGSSRHALVKFIANKYTLDITKINKHVKSVLINGVKDGSLKQTKGQGATGSFKIGDKLKDQEKSEKKKVEPKPKTVKPAEKKKTVKTDKKVTKTSGDEKPKKNITKISKVKAPMPVTTSTITVKKTEKLNQVKATKPTKAPSKTTTTTSTKSTLAAKKKQVVQKTKPAKPVEAAKTPLKAKKAKTTKKAKKAKTAAKPASK